MEKASDLINLTTYQRGKHIVGMWAIRDSHSNVFNKNNIVVVYFTLWAKRATVTSFSDR